MARCTRVYGFEFFTFTTACAAPQRPGSCRTLKLNMYDRRRIQKRNTPLTGLIYQGEVAITRVPVRGGDYSEEIDFLGELSGVVTQASCVDAPRYKLQFPKRIARKKTPSKVLTIPSSQFFTT